MTKKYLMRFLVVFMGVLVKVLFKPMRRLPVFKLVTIALESTLIATIPMALLWDLGIGIPALPLGYGITCCIYALVVREEAWEVAFENQLPLLEELIHLWGKDEEKSYNG